MRKNGSLSVFTDLGVATSTPVESVIDEDGVITRKAIRDFEAETFEELCAEGVMAREEGDNSRWSLGDIAMKVAKSYGFDAVGEWAKEVKIARKTAYEYRRMAAYYEKSARADFPNLAYSHFRAAKSLGDIEKSIALLTLAAKEDWSVEQIEAFIIPAKEGEEGDESDPKLPIISKLPIKCVGNQKKGKTSLVTFQVASLHAEKIQELSEYLMSLDKID
jgi:hypothetical protein